MSALNPNPLFFTAESIPVGPKPEPGVIARFVDGLLIEPEPAKNRIPMPPRPKRNSADPYAIRRLWDDHPSSGVEASDDFVARCLGFESRADFRGEREKEAAEFGTPAEAESLRLSTAAEKLTARSEEAKRIAHQVDRERADVHAAIAHTRRSIEDFFAEHKAAPDREAVLRLAAIEAIKASIRGFNTIPADHCVRELMLHAARVALLPEVIGNLKDQLESLEARAKALAGAGLKSRASWLQRILS